MDRPQQVFLNGKLVLNTGLPQGCVLSPILFSAYTNNITCSREGMSLFKYADDMALVAHMDSMEALTQDQLPVFEMFSSSDFSLKFVTRSSTKELCCVVRDRAATTSQLFKPLFTQGERVEQVECLKYLGTQMDTCLSFQTHSDTIYNKALQCLHLLRKLCHSLNPFSPSIAHLGTTLSRTNRKQNSLVS